MRRVISSTRRTSQQASDSAAVVGTVAKVKIRYKSETEKMACKKVSKPSSTKAYREIGYFLLCLTLGETYMSHPRALHKAVIVNHDMVIIDLNMILLIT